MKRGPNVKFSQQAKMSVVKYASKHGVAAALCHYINKFPELKESTVRTWRNVYVAELQQKRNVQDDTCIKKLPAKKRGRPLLLGDELEKQVKTYIGYLQERGAVVNTATVLGVAQGMVRNHNGNLLACNGGHICLGKLWAKNLLSPMGMLKDRVVRQQRLQLVILKSYYSNFQ